MQNNTPESVAALVNEIRSGLDDTTLSDATKAAADTATGSIQHDLQKLAQTASLLGRCGGSLRGRLCLLLSGIARPVVEQVDLFHAAVSSTLVKLAEQSREAAGTARKVDALERRIKALESRLADEQSGEA